jgi:endonuclease/exonuclease/phosphatase family metal-dependent hydrolase
VIEANADYGYSHNGERRKVLLWSKTPWEECDRLGNDALPSGRFAAGVTAGVRFVGVCIPWKNAHVNTGRKDRARWEDHLTFCQGLKEVLAELDRDRPVCVLGDFNQRIPPANGAEPAARALADAFPADFKITTSGVLDGAGNPLIDHIVVSPSIELSALEVIPKQSRDDSRLSDHVGIVIEMETMRSIDD